MKLTVHADASAFQVAARMADVRGMASLDRDLIVAQHDRLLAARVATVADGERLSLNADEVAALGRLQGAGPFTFEQGGRYHAGYRSATRTLRIEGGAYRATLERAPHATPMGIHMEIDHAAALPKFLAKAREIPATPVRRATLDAGRTPSVAVEIVDGVLTATACEEDARRVSRGGLKAALRFLGKKDLRVGRGFVYSGVVLVLTSGETTAVVAAREAGA